MSSFLILVAVYFLSIATFLEWGGFSRQTPVGLWIVYLVFNGAALLVYFILQVILVATTLADRWPIGKFYIFFFDCILFYFISCFSFFALFSFFFSLSFWMVQITKNLYFCYSSFYR